LGGDDGAHQTFKLPKPSNFFKLPKKRRKTNKVLDTSVFFYWEASENAQKRHFLRGSILAGMEHSDTLAGVGTAK
jgi:hypothetical protein